MSPFRGPLLLVALAAVSLCVLLASFVAPATSDASDISIDFPNQGMVLRAGPTNIWGTMDNSFDIGQAIHVSIQREFRDGQLAAPSAGFMKHCTLGCVLFNSLGWAWTDTEDDAYVRYLQKGGSLPTEDGQWRVTARQFGDRDIETALSFTIDSTPPDTAVTSGPPQYTNSTTASFDLNGHDPAPVSGLPSGVTYFDCSLDGGPWEHCTEPYSNGMGRTAELDFPGHVELTGLTEGGHTLEVKAIDNANNEDLTPAVYTWSVDQTKPNITINTPAVRQRFTLGQQVASDFFCVDPTVGTPPVASGIKSCDGPSMVDTSRLGNFVFRVDAEDNAGNTNFKKVAYAVDPPKYNDLVAPKHPIAYYRLGDPVGATTMTDSSGNHRDGEYKNEISLRRPPAIACHVRPHAPYVCDLNADPQDWSATFPARDGYGFTNNVNAPTTAYTWEAWINRADDKAGSIAGQGGAGQLFVNSEGKLALRQTQDTVTSEGPVLTPGQWWHVAATWDGHNTRLYVNGDLVGFSNSANKPPSGSSTLFVGYGEQAPWFHGSLDEVAYYGSALSQHDLRTRYVVGTARDVPGPVDGPAIQRPSADIHQPNNGGLYAPGKVPPLHFACDDLDGFETVASCTATVDGAPIPNEGTLPDTPGEHTIVVTAIDFSELTRSHTHRYTVKSFEDIYNADAPLVYYRLGDAQNGPMKDSGPNRNDGIYKNAQESGGIGISGDGDRARRFFGSSGYGYAQNIQAPRFQSTIEVWVNPEDRREQSIVGHGDAGEIYIGTDGVLTFRHMGVEVSTSALPVGVFSQVVGVWDGTSILLYVDGELRAEAEATRRPSSSSTFYVGYGEIKPWFKGSLDEVAYYGKALSANRILEHYLADPPPPVETFGDEPVIVDPGDPTEPQAPDDPDEPVSSDDPDQTPATGDKPANVDDPVISESGTPKSTRILRKKAALKKCQKIKKKSKRKKCAKRVNRSFR